MKYIVKLSLSLLMGLLAGNAHAQDKVFIADSVMAAYMESGYANKHFLPKGSYKGEKRVGKWKDYEVRFDNVFVLSSKDEPKVLNSVFLVYGLGKYDNDQREGEWKEYVIEDKTFEKIHFRTATYVNGKQEGVMTYFFPNGKVAGKLKFVDDQLNGQYEQYFIDGSVFIKGEFVNDNREGIVTTYFYSGQVRSKANYLNDSLNGEYILYYEDGKTQMYAEYKKGLDHGAYRYYRESGQLWTEKHYNEGLLMNVRTYDKTGKEIDNGTLKDGNGTVKYFQKSGEVYLTETYENGKLVDEKRSEDGEFRW